MNCRLSYGGGRKKSLESAFLISRFYKWQPESSTKHKKDNKEEVRKTGKKKEESVFAGAGYLVCEC